MKSLSVKLFLIKDQHRKIYLYVSVLVLLITGVSKLIMLAGTTDMLGQFDPLTGVPFKNLLIIAGVGEIIVAICVLFISNQRVNYLLIAFVSSVFVFYRLVFNLTGWRKPCYCLGNLTDILKISPLVADIIALFILGILFLGSYFYLLNDYCQNTKTSGREIGV